MRLRILARESYLVLHEYLHLGIIMCDNLSYEIYFYNIYLLIYFLYKFLGSVRDYDKIDSLQTDTKNIIQLRQNKNHPNVRQ